MGLRRMTLAVVVNLDLLDTLTLVSSFSGFVIRLQRHAVLLAGTCIYRQFTPKLETAYN